MFDVEKIRKDFPYLKKGLVYLDSAATAQKSNSVIDAISKFYRDEYAIVHRAIYDAATEATEKYNEARSAAKAFIGAEKEEEVIFVRGTTEGINLVAFSFGEAFIKEGDEILISAMEHHSNIIPWQMLAQRKKALLKVFPFDKDGVLCLNLFKKKLSSKTKIVAVAHVSNTTGTIHPIKEIIDLAHKKGAKVLIDGAQAAAHMPLNVKDLDADFYVFSGHKLYGPTGVGILYGKEELLNSMPPYQGGGNMVDVVLFEKTTYQKSPLKFEAGTPMIAEVIGLKAAFDYINSIGKEEIRKWESKLFLYALEKIKEIKGLRVIGNAPNRGTLISFVVDKCHPLDIATFLNLKNICVRSGNLCAQPTMNFFGTPAVVRSSFAIYNTFDEIDFFIDSLKKVIIKLI